MKMRAILILGTVILGIVSCERGDTRKKEIPRAKVEVDTRAPEAAEKEYWSWVEHMGRSPDRFDYLLDAARGITYARTLSDSTLRHKTEGKAEQFLAVWDESFKQPGTRPPDFYTKYGEMAQYMKGEMEAVLRKTPDHPYKGRLEDAIKELDLVAEKRK
jgi:hypothetical protein